MAEARAGSALRVYQLLLVLAVGWLAGRLPQLLADSAAEQERLGAALAPAAAPTPATAPVDAAAIAADVAAQVAAEVANETVARLIAAGWGPGGQVQRIRIEQAPAPRAPETVVRVVTEAQPALAGIDYSLPAGNAKAAAPALGPTAADAPPPAASLQAHAVATQGYAALNAGRRREGVGLLQAAVEMAPDAPEAAGWSADVKRLTRRWAVTGYTLSRGAGSSDPLAASPVLGGSQTGAAVVYTLDPLARRPVAIVGRVAAAAGATGSIDGETAEAALGVRVQPLPGVPVAVDLERRFALGRFARSIFAARLSGGGAGTMKALGRPVNLSGYGEAGVVGFGADPDLYAGGQARGAMPLFALGRVKRDAGVGAWGAAQRSFGETASRLDLGPSARFDIAPFPFFAQVDYRARVAGNALPGSGPVLTVAGEF
jgi:hypothetical protein